MAKFNIKELRKLTPLERQKKLEDLRIDLQNARAVNASGGSPPNPMLIRETRHAIARILTIQREER
ncbi:MAG: 50S ribosomal protein L29 [Promethearchaeota archaeon CR_4]|nr:MAG: 50S ribosomal protein L29 [Candidatus Lokiarchaeota archaeon CR_4]